MFNKRRNDIERLDCDIHSVAKEVNENRDAIKRLAVLVDKQTLHIASLIQPIHRDLVAMKSELKQFNDKLRVAVSSNKSLQDAYQTTSVMRKDFDGMITELDRIKTTVKKLNKDLGNA